MTRVGLTGGLASGKTFVAQVLQDLGCHVIHADQLGHEVLAPGGEAYAGVVEEFGHEILTPEGAIDRRKLAAEVFQNVDRLNSLNRLVHPAVIRREEELMAQLRQSDPTGIVVVEAAILIETGSYRRFDRLILVVCTEEQQIRRAMERDGSTREEVVARLRRQMPLLDKQKFADYIIDTSGVMESTVDQIRRVYESLRGIRA